MFFVRSASARDMKAVSELLGLAWHATYDRLYGVGKVDELTRAWYSVDALSAKLARKNSEFVVADDGRQLGGTGYAALAADRPKTIVLHHLYVHPSYQRQGIGSDMFAELETCFPDAERIELEVDPQNDNALAFYRRLGFAEIGRTENCGGGQSGIPALILAKAIL